MSASVNQLNVSHDNHQSRCREKRPASASTVQMAIHDDVIKWKIHVTGPWWGECIGHRWIPLTKASDGASLLSLIYAWKNDWANNRYAGDLRRHRAHYDVTAICYSMIQYVVKWSTTLTNAVNSSNIWFTNYTNYVPWATNNRFLFETLRRKLTSVVILF